MQYFINQKLDDIKIALNTTYKSVGYILDRTNPTLIGDLQLFTANQEANLNDLVILEQTLYDRQKTILPNSVAFEAIEQILLLIKTFLHDYQIGNNINLDYEITSSAIANIIKTNIYDRLNYNFNSYTNDQIGAKSLTSDILTSLRTNSEIGTYTSSSALISAILAFPGGVNFAAISMINSLNSLDRLFSNEALISKIEIFNNPSIDFSSDFWDEYNFQYAQIDLVNFVNTLAIKIKKHDTLLNTLSNYAYNSDLEYLSSSFTSFETLVSNTYQIIGDYAYKSDVSAINDALSSYAYATEVNAINESLLGFQALVSSTYQIIGDYAYKSDVTHVSNVISSSIDNLEFDLLSLEASLSNYVLKSNVQLGTLGSLYSCPSLDAAASDIRLIATGSADIGTKLREMQKCNNWAYETEFYTFPDFSIIRDGNLPNVYVSNSPSGPCFDCVGGYFIPEMNIASSGIGLGITSEISISNIPITCQDDTCHSATTHFNIFLFTIEFPEVPFNCASGICTSPNQFLECSTVETLVVQCSSVEYETSLIIPSIIASAVPPTAGSLASFCQYQLDHEPVV